MKDMTSATTPEEPILFRPMLESLEPRRLLSAAVPEPVVSFAEFSFAPSGGSSTTMEVPVQVDFHPYMSAPLGARRVVESFESPFGDRSFSVTFFVTPWSAPTSPTNAPPATQPPATPNDAKLASTPTIDTKSDAEDQATTLSLDTAKAQASALPSVAPSTDPAVFASTVVEEVDPTPRATNAKSTTDASAHASEDSPLAQLVREDEIFRNTTQAQSAKPWFQVLDPDVLHQRNHVEELNVTSGTPAQVAMRQADQAESLRTLAHRIALQQSLARAVQPVTASVESTPISIWQRMAMVTLTGGALVANWYVRRRRAKLALHGFERNSIGRHPHLP